MMEWLCESMTSMRWERLCVAFAHGAIGAVIGILGVGWQTRKEIWQTRKDIARLRDRINERAADEG